MNIKNLGLEELSIAENQNINGGGFKDFCDAALDYVKGAYVAGVVALNNFLNPGNPIY